MLKLMSELFVMAGKAVRSVPFRRDYLSFCRFPSQPYKVTSFTLAFSDHDLNYKSRFELIFLCSLKYDQKHIKAFFRWKVEFFIEYKNLLILG